ncbi:hypothetical protein [Sphingomonas antarctica]|uniref:hypothetical protein n=1 Tax=Sphingomonas antarctica TaxID=2040274 RepID=UPI0039E9CED6
MRNEVPSSRAINIQGTEADVRAECDKLSLPISAIETLLSGGTRVVMTTGAAADRVRKAFKGRLITGDVRRLAWSAHR